MITGADGRLWLTNDGRLRLELQSDAGDAQIVSDGQRFSLYDATSNTVYTGALPAQRAEQPPRTSSRRRSPASAGTSPTSAGCGTSPAPRRRTRPAGRATRCASHPKNDGGLLGAAEVAWDAARGVPLRAAVYAQGETKPVLELAVTDITYGKVPVADVAVKPPAGAKTVELDPPGGPDTHGRNQAARPRRRPAPGRLPGRRAPSLAGLPRQEVRLVRFGPTTARS